MPPHTRSRILLVFCLSLMPLVKGQYPHQQELEPEFLAPLENHTVPQGREVSFTCVVNHLGQYKVAWIKADTKAILGIHNHMVAHNSRLSVTHNGHNTWKLHIQGVQRGDSGEYMCQINTDPMKTQIGYLEVTIPPDILDKESSEDGVALEGGTVQIKCVATGLPEPTVTWRREDSKSIVLRQDGSREKQVVRTVEGEVLLLTNVVRSDMGNYLCIASNGVPPSVSRRFAVNVHFHPMIKVSNQLVAAPAGSDVTVQCYVEASPKAMNSWHRDTGEKLMENANKYVIAENAITPYSLYMNLTIRNLEKRDFGGYLCFSSNALGRVEAGVRLQELKLPPATTTLPPPRPPTPSHKVVKQHKERRRKPKKPKPVGVDETSGEDEDSEEVTSMVPSPPEQMRPTPPPMDAAPKTTRHPWVMHNEVGAAATSLPAALLSLAALATLRLLSA
ncbi:lachesin-like [Neocloeon triangulifer]|uniref:lachesin-like n=1 Tax=Neocloeon triangulifer TaxID=2078957 RepID=UPI00286F10B0|nr:lachesin-like [Neocloeon triangulifer]XP_059470074.1 lachesin-like [Neocloeon triangulifer]